MSYLPLDARRLCGKVAAQPQDTGGSVISDRLKAARKRCKLSKRAVAQATNCSVEQVKSYENFCSMRDESYILDFAIATGVSIDGILFDGEPLIKKREDAAAQ